MTNLDRMKERAEKIAYDMPGAGRIDARIVFIEKALIETWNEAIEETSKIVSIHVDCTCGAGCDCDCHNFDIRNFARMSKEYILELKEKQEVEI